MELQENKIYSNSELAEWFGVKEVTFIQKKRKKLEELKYFADFTEVKRKVRITKVYNPIYEKQSRKDANDKIYQKEIYKIIDKQPLQMYKTLAGRIYQNGGRRYKNLNHSFRTTYEYTRRNTKSMFITDRTHGVVTERVWCQRFYKTDCDFIPLDEEQLKDWNSMLCAHYENYNLEYAKHMSEVQQKEEMEENMEKLRKLGYECYMAAQMEFMEKYHFEPVAVKQFEINAWNEEKEQQEK